jgi:hypothetical protein
MREWEAYEKDRARTQRQVDVGNRGIRPVFEAYETHKGQSSNGGQSGGRGSTMCTSHLFGEPWNMSGRIFAGPDTACCL